jgi:sodium/proline symporter
VASAQNVATLTQVISAETGDRMQPTVARCAALISLLMLSLQVTIIARTGAEWLAMDAGIGQTTALVLGVGLIGMCITVGGLRAASAFDAVQTLAILCVSLLLLAAAYVALGGVAPLVRGLQDLYPAAPWFGGKRGVVAVAFMIGAFAMGAAVVGQPQAMSRLIALKDDNELRRARWIAVVLTIVVLSLVMLCGWCARVLYDGLATPQLALHALATRMLPPSLAAMLVAAVCVAILLSIASPLQALASQLSVDLRRPTATLSLPLMHAVVVTLTVCAVFAASYLPLRLLDHSMLPFTALGAAFGPLLLVRLSGKRIRPGSTLGAMWTGFILTVIFHLLPNAPGDFLERVLPFLAALGIALTGGERRRNPDRADRAQETVHDRIPI